MPQNDTIVQINTIVKYSHPPHQRKAAADHVDSTNVYASACRWMVRSCFIVILQIGVKLYFSISDRQTIKSVQRKVNSICNLFEFEEDRNPLIVFSIRQIQSDSMTMATVNDSARIASMAKKRKSKSKPSRGRFDGFLSMDLNPSLLFQIIQSIWKYRRQRTISLNLFTIRT